MFVEEEKQLDYKEQKQNSIIYIKYQQNTNKDSFTKGWPTERIQIAQKSQVDWGHKKWTFVKQARED